MANAVFVQKADSIDYTPAAAVAAGDVVVQGELVGVARTPIAANALGSLGVCGIFKFPKTNPDATLTAGVLAYWDATNKVATTDPAAGANKLIGPVVAAAGNTDTTVLARLCGAQYAVDDLRNAIADPGNAGAIPVTRSGHVEIVTAAAETRTIAAPSFVGQQLLLSMKTDGGDAVVTVATTVNQTGNNTITFNDAGDSVLLIAKASGANKRWSVVVNDGAALSTV